MAVCTASKVSVVIATMTPTLARSCMSIRAFAPSGVKALMFCSMATICVAIFCNSGTAKVWIEFHMSEPRFSPADTIASTSAVASRAMLSSCPCPGFLGDFDSDSGADQRSDASDQDRVLGDLRNAGAALRLVKFPEIADAALHQLQQSDRAIVLRDLRRVARQLASRHCCS